MMLDRPIEEVCGLPQKESTSRSGTSLCLSVSAGIATDSRRRRLVERKVLAVLPGAFIEDHPGSAEIVVNSGEYSGLSFTTLDADRINDMLSALPDNPVLGVVPGLLPMQVLVATAYRLSASELLELANIDTVLHVAVADPRDVYDGYVVSLLVPRLGESDVMKQLGLKVRELLSLVPVKPAPA